MNNNMRGFVSDTMAIVLWMEKRRMPQNVKTLFSKMEGNEVSFFIPAMVVVEIGYLSERKRIEIRVGDVISYTAKHENIRIQSMDIDLIRSAFEINDIPELHDRLIAAAGRLGGFPVITNDPKIIASKFVSTICE